MWGLGILKGMAVTARAWFRPAMTVRYPEQRLELPERARWMLAHRMDDEGRPLCTACLACERECPDGIISITVSKGDDGAKRIDEYRYELGACMMCGLCVEACRFDAIEMSHDYELATADRGTLVRVLLSDVAVALPKRGGAE